MSYTNPHDRGDMPKYLPAGLTQYVLNNFSKKFPPYRVTQDDVSTPPWEREMDLQLSRHTILRYWAGTPNQHRQTNGLYRGVRIGEAQRELSRSRGERSLAPGYGCVSLADWLRRYCDTVLPNGVRFWYKGDDGLWWLRKISAITPTDGAYFWFDFRTTRDRSSFLFLRRATRL